MTVGCRGASRVHPRDPHGPGPTGPQDRPGAGRLPRCPDRLHFDDPFQLLVVTVLSAQTTDRRVNAVRPTLFVATPTRRRWRRPRASTSSRSSARSASSARRPTRCSSSAPPSSSGTTARCRRDSTTWSPSRGWSQDPSSRQSLRHPRHHRRHPLRPTGTPLRLAEETDPVKVEHAVGALFEKRDWVMLCHHLIWHGRRVCHAKKPACGACPVARWCPSYGEGPTDPETAAKLVRTQGPA